MIQLDNVTYHYPRAEMPALDGLNLDIPAGQFCAVVGANLAGKSTLCNALAGFVPHFYRGRLDGTITVGETNIAESSLAELAGQVGLVFANPFNQITGARFTVFDEVAFGLENLGVPPDEMRVRVAEALEVVGLSDVAGRSPFALSGGQQQRVAIASVLVMRPRVMVLDEPTSQLDPTGSREVFEVLRDLAAAGETTVVLAEHKLEWIAAFADRVLVLSQGRIVADGTPGDVLASPQLLDYGLRPTRYTQAAAAAREAGLASPDGPLPVALDETIDFLES